MSRKHTFAEGEYYHLYNRGNGRREIYKNDHDYRRALALLYLANGTKNVNLAEFFRTPRPFSDVFQEDRGEAFVDIGAYCLMPNHFHILIRARSDKGTSAFMKKFSTAYSMYFNKKHDHSGSLYEGSYKAQHATTDEYLKYLFAYIHLNPVKLIDPKWKENGIADREAAKKFLEEYRYSSYSAHAGEPSPQDAILNKDAFPEYFQDKTEFEEYVHDWLVHDPKRLSRDKI